MGAYYGFDESALMDEEFLSLILGIYGVVLVFSLILGIACYILSALSVQQIARRRGLSNPWLAWLPVGSEWIIGSISDQYRYLVKGEVRNKRKALLGLSLTNLLSCVVTIVFAVALVIQTVVIAEQSMNQTLSDGAMASMLLAPTMGMTAAGCILSVVSIVLLVFRHMAMYDLYRSCDPNNAVAYLVLGILFRFLEPIFLMIVRKKDNGMPPRRDAIPFEE